MLKEGNKRPNLTLYDAISQADAVLQLKDSDIKPQKMLPLFRSTTAEDNCKDIVRITSFSVPFFNKPLSPDTHPPKTQFLTAFIHHNIQNEAPTNNLNGSIVKNT